MNKKKDLKREINFLGLSSNIINTVIGSGIFVLPAIIAAALGAASILAYIFCGILITLLMLCVAEVASKITDSGGVYIYIEKTFGRYPGFLAVCVLSLSTLTGIAAIANAVVNVIFKLLPSVEGDVIRIMFFVFMFSGLGYVNILGVKKGVGFVKFITIIKIVPLLLIVFIGFKDVDLSNLVWETTPTIQQIGTTSLVLYFAFTGAGTALSVSGEVINPQRTIPWAIIFSIFMVGLIYISVQTVAQGVLGASLPSFTDNPLGEVANHIFGPIGFTLLTIGAGVSMFGSISSLILSFPRVLFAASKDNVLPIKMLSKIHGEYITPHVAIIVSVSICFILASFGGFQELAIISSASSLLISLGLSIATIKLRMNKKFNSDVKTFKIPGGYTIPVLSIIVILWFLSNLSKTNILGFSVLIIIITFLYFLINSKLIKQHNKK